MYTLILAKLTLQLGDKSFYSWMAVLSTSVNNCNIDCDCSDLFEIQVFR